MAKPKLCPVPGAVRFFMQNAGVGYRPDVEKRRHGQRRGAQQLAIAECVMEREGAEVQWTEDQDAWSTDPERYESAKEVLCAQLVRDGRVVQSLCGIDDPTRAYARVVEAELASEEFAPQIRPIMEQVTARRGQPVRFSGRQPKSTPIKRCVEALKALSADPAFDGSETDVYAWVVQKYGWEAASVQACKRASGAWRASQRARRRRR